MESQPDLTSPIIVNEPGKDVGLVKSDIAAAATREKRKDLANHIDSMWNAAMLQKGDIHKRWEQCEAFYRNQPPARIESGYRHASNQHFPLIEPKINTIIANVCGTMSAIKPYASAKGRANKGARIEALEHDMHTILQRANFDLKIRELAVTAANTNCAIARVHFDATAKGFPTGDVLPEATKVDEIEYAGIIIDHIHPNDFGLYPLACKDIAKATLVGHRFFTTVGEIRENQIANRYFADYSGIGGDLAEMYESGHDPAFDRTQISAGIMDNADQMVECVALLLKADLEKSGNGFRRWYEVIYARDTVEILHLKRYSLPRPWYFDIFFKVDPENFFGATSLSQSLCALQIQYNSLNNLLIDGSWIAAFPVAFVKQGSLPENFTAYKPGEFYETILPVEAQFLQIQFQVGAIPAILANIERLAEGVVHVAPASEGKDPTSHVSATYTSGQLQYQAAHLNEYAALFGIGLQPLVAFSALVVKDNFKLMKIVYGDSMQTEDESEWAVPVIWEMTGKTPSNTPVQRLQMVQAVLEVIRGFPAVGQMLDVRQLILDLMDATQLPNADKIVRSLEQFTDRQIMDAAGKALVQLVQSLVAEVQSGRDVDIEHVEQALTAIAEQLTQGGNNDAAETTGGPSGPAGPQQILGVPGMESSQALSGSGAGPLA